jgi:monofunctional biosynthetic peptidoglycan transglycosylase
MNTTSLPMDATPWLTVNDGVMGGISDSQMVSEHDVLVFSGNLSLENNGGFASARRPVHSLPETTDRVRLEVRGDGRRYQFRIRQDNRFDGVAWSQAFTTTPDWQSIDLPLNEFVAVYRGHRVSNAGAVVADRIKQLGFMLADKRSGPFRLEIRQVAFMTGEEK